MSRSQHHIKSRRKLANSSLVQRQPLTNQVHQLLDNIYSMVELKLPEAALKLLATLQEVDPANPEALYLEGELEMQRGNIERALQSFTMAVYHRSNDPKLFGYLAKLNAQLGNYQASINAMHRLIELAPNNAQAMQTLAALYYITSGEQRLGRKERGRYWVSQAARLEPIYRPNRKNKTVPRLRMLALQSAESTEWSLDIQRFAPAMSEGHNNLISVLDNENIEITQVFVDHIDRAPEILRKLPKVDVVYNSITDADRCAEALAKAHILCEKIGMPVINPPQAVLKTSRENNYQRYKDDATLILPKSIRLDRMQGSTKTLLEDVMVEHSFELPLIVRLAGFQGGKYMHKVDDLENHDFSELDAELAKQPQTLYVIQYHAVDYTDERAPDTCLYPKYRAFMVGGKLYPAHLFTADDYNVHKKNAGPIMQAHSWLIDKERDYCQDPVAHLGKTQWSALENALRQTGLGYNGVDFAPATGSDTAGRIVVFEINPAMRNRVNQLPEGDHVQIAWRMITEATHHHFATQAGVPSWEFRIPRGQDATLIIPLDVTFSEKLPVVGHQASNQRWLKKLLGKPNDFSDSPFFNTQHYIDEELLTREAHEQGIAMQRRPFRMLEFTQGDREVVFHINAPRIPMDVHLMQRDKLLVKELLRRHNLPTPQAEAFTDFQAAYRYFAQCTRPQVVKPTDGFASRGVTVDVTTPEQFQAAWKKAREIGRTIMVEDMIVGEELRVYFHAGEFVKARVRAPGFVVGDGVSTIAQLIEAKNADRAKNPVTAKGLIKEVPALEKAGRTLNDIPLRNEWVALGEGRMVTLASDNIPLELSESLIEIATQAARLLPARTCGVDMFVEDLAQGHGVWITELNSSTPNLANFHFPSFGAVTPLAERLLSHSLEELAQPIEPQSGHLLPASVCQPMGEGRSDFATDYLQMIACAHNLPCRRLDEHHDALLLGNPARLGWIEGVSTHTTLESVQILRHPDWLHSRLQAFDIPSDMPDGAFEVRMLMAGHRLLAAHANQDGTWKDVSESLHQGIADVAAKAMHAIYSPGHALLTLNLTALEEHPETAGWSLGFVDLQPDLSVFYTAIDRPRDVISALLAVWWPDYDQAVEQPVAQRLNLTGRWHEVQVGAANWLQQQMDRHMLEGEVQALESGAFEVHVQGQPNAVQAFTEHCRFVAFIDAVELSEADFKTPALANTDALTLRLVITGKVQGVGYRRWFANQLTERGIAGWVRNLSDGSVEAVIHGPQETLQPLLDEVPTGSKNTDVTGLNAELWEGELPVGVTILSDETTS